MRLVRCCALFAVAVFASAWSEVACAQASTAINQNQATTVQGLRASAAKGAYRSAAYAADGSLLLLYDQGDGLRVQHTDAALATTIGEAHLGAAGDSGLAMALDPAGNVYVAGTTTSAQLTGTSGVPFPTRADTSTNGFLAKFDANLNLQWLTFLGTGRMTVAGVAATADSVFVTGTTYSAALPVTASAIGQAPASGTFGNGFVERFNTAGTRMIYATYLTGVNGDTTPGGIAADASDNAYVVGTTASSGYPTTAALQPRILLSSGVTTSGFLTKLTPAGDGYVFSTFIAGAGLTGIALDRAGNNLLLSGSVSLGQFAMLSAPGPVVATGYQTLAKIPTDGQSVTASIPLLPGSSSVVTPDADGGAWVAGRSTLPLYPGVAMPYNTAGDGFLLHVALASGGFTVDQTARLGGVPASGATFTTFDTTPGVPAVSADGNSVAVPSTLSLTVGAALATTQRFDLPLVGSPTTALPSTLRDAAPASCSGGSQCSGSAGMVSLVRTDATGSAALGISADRLPNLTVRNLGSVSATGLSIAAAGFTVSTGCGTTLLPSASCPVLLSGSGPGSITVSAANGGTTTLSLPAATQAAEPVVPSTNELDFGTVASTTGAVPRTVIVDNLTSSSQSFASAQDGGGTVHGYTLAETASTCGGAVGSGTHTVGPNASCTITVSLTASSTPANDGAMTGAWKIGSRDVLLTGWVQASPLALSTTEADFGVQFTNTPALNQARTLFLSNIATIPLVHSSVSQPTGSPFALNDTCPGSLPPGSVCALGMRYTQTAAPASDTTTLALDGGQSVLVTGETLSPATVTGSASNPSLSLSATSFTFPSSVVVTGISGAVQTVTVKNTGSSAFGLTLAIAGDFAETDNCNGGLAAGATCLIQVRFLPSQPGARDGLLSVTAGIGFAPALVTLGGTALPLLPANNGTLALGQATVGEPLVAWYKIQQAVTSLTATVPAGSGYGVALVTDNGTGHGSLPASEFNQSVTAGCGSCWLGIQLLSSTAGTANSSLSLSTVSAGKAYTVALTGTVAPVSGLLLTPATADFGTVSLGSVSSAETLILANLLSPAGDVAILGVAATGDFSTAISGTGMTGCSGTLNATSSCAIAVSFAPTATGLRTGTLTVTTSGGTATVSLSGYGTASQGLALSPTSLHFENVPGQAATVQTILITNSSTTPMIVSAASLAPAMAGTFATNSTCGTLAPGATCRLTVTYTPGAAIVASSLSFTSTATINGQAIVTPYTVTLNGNYTANEAGLLLTPSTINFGATADDTVGLTRQLTLTNFSAKTMNVVLQLPRQFALSSPQTCTTLAAGASCSFSVTFLPQTAGALTGTVLATGSPTDGTSALSALSYLLGYGEGAGTLTISGNIIPNTPLSFGQVTSGQSVSQTLTLRNSGTGPLNVRRLSSEPPFQLTTTCGSTLAVTESCTATLAYTPVYELGSTSGGYTLRNDAGTLIVETDAASSPDALELTGIASPVASSSPAPSGQLETFSLSNGALTFANTQVGDASPAQTLTLLNDGSTTLHLAAITAPLDFKETDTCGTLLPGSACSVSVSFTPGNESTAALRSGTLEIASDASTALEFVTLVGSSAASPLTLSPTALNFGTVNLGQGDQLTVTVTDAGPVPVTFTGVTTTGDYTVARNTCPANGQQLAAGTSCTLIITFAPTVNGTRAGTLSISSDASQLPLTVALTGVGASSQLVVTPGALDFGVITAGARSTLLLNLQNTGTLAITGLANTISGPDAALFAVTTPCPSLTLAPGASCTEQVTFFPTAVGARSATLSLASSAPNSPATIPLTGSGVANGGGGGTGGSGGTGSFQLTVNGGSAATITVTSGSPATYALTVTPAGGFTGNVALTCTPVGIVQFASCSLLYPSVNILSGAQSATATVNTITSVAGWLTPFGVLLVLPLGQLARRNYRTRLQRIAVLTVFGLAAAGWVGLAGCGGGGQQPTPLRSTPPGTYQYLVTASSTTGNVVSSTVTLNLVVK